MKIANSSISMSAQTSYVEQYSLDESLKTWVGNQRPDFEGKNTNLPSNKSAVKLDLSDAAKAMAAKEKNDAQSVNDDDNGYTDLSDKDKAKIKMLEDFLSAIMHKRIKLVVPDNIKLKGDKINADLSGKQLEVQAPQGQGWGLEYDRHESYSEKEKMSFDSNGTIQTADGKTINFSVNLNMSREFASQQDISIRAGDALKKDPLVINFDGNVPGLTNKKISFDIDNDGKDNQISFVNPGSGFLSLDLNNDGKINNGTELFGPNSGNGFSELAAYDKDKNNWIDENDAVFQKLRIWTKDENGNDKLFALGEKGIGAIYLGNVNTDYNIKDTSNTLQGEIKQTGIFVKENGTVGTIQHIDLAI